MGIRTDLFLGDCKTMLKRLSDNSVDLIVLTQAD
jgi:predicted methyltransferase